jgi:hypothetical protein
MIGGWSIMHDVQDFLGHFLLMVVGSTASSALVLIFTGLGPRFQVRSFPELKSFGKEEAETILRDSLRKAVPLRRALIYHLILVGVLSLAFSLWLTVLGTTTGPAWIALSTLGLGLSAGLAVAIREWVAIRWMKIYLKRSLGTGQV